MYKDRNILVTGGGGLVGQSLIKKLLKAGAHVRATQYKGRKIKTRHKRLEIVSCDLTDQDDARSVFADMDSVFLGAAKVGGAKANRDSASDLIMYNLHLSSSLIALASKMELDSCAFISSSFVYPISDSAHDEIEGFMGDPASFGLGWIKRYLETLCQHFHQTGLTNYAIIRPTAYYGPHDNFDSETCHVVPALLKKAMARDDPFEVWGDGNEVRAFTYVEDLVDGLMLTLERHAVADPLNICTAETNSVKDLVKIILNVANYHTRIRYLSDKPTSLRTVVSDTAKAKEVLGWEATTTLKEGIKLTWQALNTRQKAFR